MKRLNSSGDTIVEVLICLAIMGFTLGAAYSIANRSLLSIRDAQERGEATKYAEIQLERLRYIVYDKGQQPSGNFCIKDDFSTGAASACAKGIYTPSIQYSAASGGIYTITTSWQGIGGRNIEQVQLYYRAYP
jgi:type II secretory pathway pseudopilin PulG